MNNREYYDRISEKYAGREALGYHRFLNETTVDILRSVLPGGKILDVGCGTGHLARRLIDQNGKRRVTGLDISLPMLKHFRSDCHLSAVQGLLEHLPFTADTFDGAFAMRVFPHLRNPAMALAELTRVVRPGGIILVEIYNPVSLRRGVAATARLFSRPGRTSGRRTERNPHEFIEAWPSGASDGFEDEGHTVVFTRYDTLRSFRAVIPPQLEYLSYRGLRIVTPLGRLMDTPGLSAILRALERAASRSPLKIFAGFLILILRKFD